MWPDVLLFLVPFSMLFIIYQEMFFFKKKQYGNWQQIVIYFHFYPNFSKYFLYISYFCYWNLPFFKPEMHH